MAKSRQQKWQERKVASGRCRTCGKKKEAGRKQQRCMSCTNKIVEKDMELYRINQKAKESRPC